MRDEHVFSEREVIAIIERAAEYQGESPAGRTEHGLTMAEIARIGREVGIEPDHLRRAAREIGSGSDLVTADLDARAMQVRSERWIPGRMPDSAIEDMFGEMHNRFGPEASSGWWARPTSGVERVGRTFIWNHAAARITVTDEGSGYTLRTFTTEVFNGRRAEGLIVAIWAGLAIGGLIGGAVGEVHGWQWLVLILSLSMALSLAVVPPAIRRRRARSEQRADALAREAERLLRAAGAREINEALPDAMEEPEPVLSIPGASEYASRPDAGDSVTDPAGGKSRAGTGP